MGAGRLLGQASARTALFCPIIDSFFFGCRMENARCVVLRELQVLRELDAPPDKVGTALQRLNICTKAEVKVL